MAQEMDLSCFGVHWRSTTSSCMACRPCRALDRVVEFPHHYWIRLPSNRGAWHAICSQASAVYVTANSGRAAHAGRVLPDSCGSHLAECTLLRIRSPQGIFGPCRSSVHMLD